MSESEAKKVVEQTVPNPDLNPNVKLTKKQKLMNQKTLQQANELLREMVTNGMILSLKVASCTCEKKESCGVYQEAKKLAVILDKLQSIKTR
jgi:hypothetical protein